jgi:predicted phage terminase large subunit-like protein
MFVWYTDDQYLGDCYLYSAWDFALGEKRVNDWTVGVLAAQKPDGRVIVLDMQRFRSGDQIKIADTILNHYQDHPNVRVIGVEDGQIWKGIEPPLKAQMLKRKLFPTLQPCQPLTDKLIRAQPLQGLMQQHQVLFPKNLPWIGLMHKELLRFPGGVHDDIVDALAWLARVILMNAPPKGARPPKSKAEKTVAEKIRELGKVGGGRTGMMAA